MKVFQNITDKSPAEMGDEAIARFTVGREEIDVIQRYGPLGESLEIRGRGGVLTISLHASNVFYVSTE
jgi:hypothetical protein